MEEASTAGLTKNVRSSTKAERRLFHNGFNRGIREIQRSYRNHKRWNWILLAMGGLLILLGFIFYNKCVLFWLGALILMLFTLFRSLGGKKSHIERLTYTKRLQEAAERDIATSNVTDIRCTPTRILIFDDVVICDGNEGLYLAIPPMCEIDLDESTKSTHLIYTEPEGRWIRFKSTPGGSPQFSYHEKESGWMSFNPIIFSVPREADPDTILTHLLAAPCFVEPTPSFVLDDPTLPPMFASSPGVRGCLLTALALFNILMLAGFLDLSQGYWAYGILWAFSFLILLTIMSPKFLWAARGVTLIVFLVFAWYVFHELRHHPEKITDLNVRRSETSPVNAIKGMIVFGLPALWFTITGGKTRKRPPSEVKKGQTK